MTGAPPPVAPARGERVAALRLERPPPDSLMVAAFTVDRPVEVTIEAVGMVPRLSPEYSATAWLLDAKTREAVWALDRGQRREEPQSRFLRGGEDRVRLAPGTYALYLFASSRWRDGAPFQDWSNVLNDLADMVNKEDPRKDLSPYLARVHAVLSQSPGEPPALAPCRLPPRAGALIALAPAGIKADLAQPFRLERETALRLIATGRSLRDTTALADYGWIETPGGETVWRMEGARCRHAGGARKNRHCDEEIRLPAGDYVARFGTGSSHAAGDWNAVPPRDPDGWGLVILPAAGARVSGLRTLAGAEILRDPALLVRLDCVRDDEHRRAAFTLARPSRLRVEALGEASGKKLADYGWIVDAASGGTVWKMNYEATGPAGGGAKNRAFSGEIELPAGSYEAHFVTDDSHAWTDWNAAPPPVPHAWGMTVRLAAAAPAR